MATTRDIKRKIKSVKSTQQITKAMNLVASSKLQRAKTRLKETRPFFGEISRVMASIINSMDDMNHPYIQKREVKNTLLIVLTGDKGLCGGFNSNVIKEARKIIAEKENNVELVIAGNKGVEYFKTKHMMPVKYITGMSDKPFYEDAAELGKYVFYKFAKGEVDEVLIAYTVFNSVISQETVVETLLPIDPAEYKEDSDGAKTSKGTMEFEPSADVVLSYVIPKYVNTIIYGAMVESAACELGARTTSMDNATKNADERIDDMTILYNRVRQGSITQEITEIVAGANALK